MDKKENVVEPAVPTARRATEPQEAQSDAPSPEPVVAASEDDACAYEYEEIACTD